MSFNQMTICDDGECGFEPKLQYEAAEHKKTHNKYTFNLNVIFNEISIYVCICNIWNLGKRVHVGEHFLHDKYWEDIKRNTAS
jgi:hypothetical protein